MKCGLSLPRYRQKSILHIMSDFYSDYFFILAIFVSNQWIILLKFSGKYKSIYDIKKATLKQLTKICIWKFAEMRLMLSTNTLITHVHTVYRGVRSWSVHIQFLTVIFCLTIYFFFFLTIEFKTTHQNEDMSKNIFKTFQSHLFFS